MLNMKKLIPLLLIKKIPTRAVNKIIAIVFKTPISDPIEINIAISTIGIIIKIKKIIFQLLRQPLILQC